MAYTTTSEIGGANTSYYNPLLLRNAWPNLVHVMLGQEAMIPKGVSTTIKWRRFTPLTAATTALTEGVTPAGSALAKTDITATPLQYGDFVTVTDYLSMTTPDPVFTVASELLGHQAGDTFDQLTRNVVVAGTSVRYADTGGTGNSQTSDVASDDIPSVTDLKKIVRTLEANNAKRYYQMVSPDNGYGTSPINASYFGLVHPYTAYNLRGLSGFIPVESYANQGVIMPGEVGSLADIRFVSSTNAKVLTGEGAGSIDVYATMVFAKDAFGVVGINGLGLENIRKPLGSGGTSDPLNQRATSGWKGAFVSKILNDNFMVRYEHAVSA